MVGLTIGHGEPSQRISIVRVKRDVYRDGAAQHEEGLVEVTGELLFANSTTKTNTIKVVDDARNRHSFHVPEGMMADIVKPLWENRVRVVGLKKRRKVELISIDPLREIIGGER